MSNKTSNIIRQSTNFIIDLSTYSFIIYRQLMIHRTAIKTTYELISNIHTNIVFLTRND